MYSILDTNILLLDAQNLITLGKTSTIVLPETVLDEIDSKKSGHSEISYQAREFGRLLTSAEVLDTIRDDEDNVVTILRLGDVRIEVVSLNKYPGSDSVEPSIRNDRKIIEVACWYARAKPDVQFLSNDVMCRMRALSFGLAVADLKTTNSENLEFTKTLTVESELFGRLHNLPIFEVDPDYKPENYNYLFTDELTSQVKLGNIRNGIIDILGKDTETELRRQDANPQNSGHLFLSRAIQNTNVDIVVCEALAGSGKTVSAMSNAIRLIKKGVYGSITYIRASVDDVDRAEEVGFLSGNEEKMAVYLHPVHDTLDFIVRNRHKDSKLKGKAYEDFVENQIEDLIEKHNISSMIGLGLRGRTFHNTVAIIDEAQNMSKASLQKVLTRFGKDCKVIIIGSNRQIDNPYITKYTNGLSTILDACTRDHEKVKLHAVPLTKVVRSDIAEFAEKVFEK
jgi:PhoH-like ATPase